ncbi:MAG: PAS fold family [Parcubacteria group bacterium GW2011_GWD2_38_11]|nr:MAG: PAS fold family [Parcubacteria group bacterium GW2011_GWD2_38_11]
MFRDLAKSITDSISFKVLAGNISDSVYLKYYNGEKFVFIYINEAKAARSGVKPEDMLGKDDTHFMSFEEAMLSFEDDMSAYKGEEIRDRVKKITRKDGSIDYVSDTKNQLKDKDGNILGIFGISRDITRRVEIEECMRTYFSEVLHELKNKFVGYSVLRLIANGRYGKLTNSIKMRLDGIISSLLDVENLLKEALSRVKSLGFESGKLGLSEAPIDVGLEIIDKVLSNYASEIEAKNIFIDNTYGSIPEKQVFLKINFSALYSIFENLIGNAVKYVDPDGVIAIGYHIEYKLITFNVYDNGRHISEQFARDGLFGKFQRDEETQNNVEGTGIGLYHARELAEKLQGKLEFKPTADSGDNNFLLSLPIVS